MKTSFLFILLLASATPALPQEDVPPPGIEVSGQANVITQGDFNFHSPYSGANSLPGRQEVANSRVFTLYTRTWLPAGFDIETDVESAGGGGIGNALGLAGYTNLDVVRNPSLGPRPYLARLVLHRGFTLPGRAVQHLDLYAGQFSTVDWFDNNPVGSDSHTQFMNWAVDNNAAYDYAADTRGYTRGAMVQYSARRWEIRAGEMMMPTVANGLQMIWSPRTHSENFEVQRHLLLRGLTGSVRALGYVNHASMGDYREAVAAATPGQPPDIALYRHPGTVKYGLGLNLDQQLPHNLRAFARWGWNEGRYESFAYTEANSTFALGADVSYARRFKTGIALAANGISADHQNYLACGGMGFLLGDGRLHYGRETALETYTNWSLRGGLSLGLDAQYIANPGFNRDRGPVWVPAVRLHWDLPKYFRSF